MADFERLKQEYRIDWLLLRNIDGLVSPHEFYADIEKMLAIRDKIIKEFLDKEKLEKAKSRLALSKASHSRLGADTPLNPDVMDKINKNLTGRGKHSKGGKPNKKRNSKKTKKKKQKEK